MIQEKKVFETSDGSCFPSRHDAEAYQHAVDLIAERFTPFIEEINESNWTHFNESAAKELLMRWERSKYKSANVAKV